MNGRGGIQSEQMNEPEKKNKLQRKLRRLGVAKGTRHLKPAPPPKASSSPAWSQRPSPSPAATPKPLHTLLPGGKVVTTDTSQCFVVDQVYPLSYRHGSDALGDLLPLPTTAAATFCQDDRLADLDFRDFIFLDTETTGLAGAGTLAFMVGAAFFERTQSGDEVLVARQYFLRDHGDEPGLLDLLDELLADKRGLVTFNGRSFDLPLLDGRYLMNRRVTDLRERPHIDLLPPARRLWRARLGSCALSALEPNLLGLHRTEEDVPGWLIPTLYHDYLRSGDASELLRVFYHNRLDLLSMVTLATRTVRQFQRHDGVEHPLDLVSLGRWQLALGDPDTAEKTLREAVAHGDLPLSWFHKTLLELGQLLKRQDRRAEAVPLWQQVAATSFDDVAAHVELAMFYEWHADDLPAARQWTQQALSLVERWNRYQAQTIREELEHRLARLERKLGGEN